MHTVQNIVIFAIFNIMNYPDQKDLNYYRNIVSSRTRMHISLLFYKGSDLDSSPTKTTKIAKIISACANSGGGNIIFGIKPKRERAEEFSPIIGFDKSKEWLYHEIQSHIDKPIKGLDIQILDYPEIDNACLIHITIPANNNQPHMFSDNKYYMLKKSRPYVLDESEVRMLYGKLSHCELEFLGIYNTNGLPAILGGKYTSMSFYPKLLIRNAGNIVEKDYKIEISFPAKLYEETFQPLRALFIRHEGSHVVFGQKGLSPIFQEEISTMIEAKISVNTENIESFLNEYLIIKLYFSNGIKTHKIKLSETLTYNGKKLKKTDFTKNKSITINNN